MKLARPTVAEERWLTAASRHPALRAQIEALGHGGGWKTTTPLGRLLGVILTLLGMSLLGGALSAFRSPWLVAGVLLMIAAEIMIARRRVYRSGIEEMLYLGGAVAAVGQILDWSNGSSDAGAVALMSMAVLLVGWRLLNPVLTTLAAAGCSLAIGLVGSRLLGGDMRMLQSAAWCGVLAVLALVAGARHWRRPSHDFMLDGLVMVMPWLGGMWLMADAWRDDVRSWSALIVCSAAFALLLATGLHRRQHAPLVGALGSLACAGFAAHQLLDWPRYWQLIAAGILLLAVAWWSDRRLRHREDGLSSRAIDEVPGLELAQQAGAAILAPSPASGASAGAAASGQGGGFGGGGASGRF
jgi:hypothetical protein